MFLFDETAAAKLLATLEPRLIDAEIARALPERPEAWLAWDTRLRQDGRGQTADGWLERAHLRWPNHLPTRERMAARAASRQEWEALDALFPPRHFVPEEPANALLIAYRARARALRGEREGARDDAELALRLNGADARLQIVVGDVYASLEDVEGARRLWNRALFMPLARQEAVRREVLLRLARLEARHGPPATALRLWRSILEIDPRHPEAGRRVEELTGVRP
jgi:tetratricopeptide (TPR) repeat protein